MAIEPGITTKTRPEDTMDDDVRWGEVTRLRAAIAEGRYAVPAGDLAERLIARMLEDD